MTYKELAEQISELSTEQQGQDVCICDMEADEFFRVSCAGLDFNEEDDVLDAGHPLIRIKEWEDE